MRRAVQLAVQAIVPRVVRTTDAGFKYPALFTACCRAHKFGTAVPANVIEAAQYALLVTDQQDALTQYVDQAIIALALQAFEAACAKPFAVKNRVPLAHEKRRIEVLLSRQRGFELLDVCRRHMLVSVTFNRGQRQLAITHHAIRRHYYRCRA